MISCCFVVFVKLLEILDQVMYPLSIQKLLMLIIAFKLVQGSYFSNDLRRLGVVNRFQVLLHGIIIFAFLI